MSWMTRIVPFWALCLAALVQAGDGDFCVYNNITGFCVTVDAQQHNKQCLAKNGWLQFYMGDPSPRVYTGCGDDGVVLHIVCLKDSCVACVLPHPAMHSRAGLLSHNR